MSVMTKNLQTRLSHFLLLLAALAIVLASAAAVWSVHRHIWTDQGRSLSKYIEERGRREETRFDRVSTAQLLMRETFSHYRTHLTDDEIRIGIETYFPRAADGTHRSSDALWEGTFLQGAGFVFGSAGYMRADREFTPDRYRTFYAAFLTIAQHSVAADPKMDSLWFYTPDDDLVVYAPGRADNLEFYRRTSPPDFSPSTMPHSVVSTLEANPDAITRCTPLTRLAYMRDGEALSTGCQTPVREEGRQIGVFGTTLLMGDVFREAVLDLPVPTADLSMVSAQGDLIAHRNFLKSQDVSEDMLKETEAIIRPGMLVEHFRADGGQTGVLATNEGALFSALTGYYHMEIPDWYLVITIPQDTLFYQSIEQVSPIILLFLVISIAIISLLVWYIRKYGIEPIRLLSDHFRLGRDAPEDDNLETAVLRFRQDEIGELARTLQQYKDTTEAHLRDLESVVADRTKELANAYDAKSTFLTTLSHELRTPMNGIMGVAGALHRSGLTSQQTEMVNLIQKSSEILERQLSDVLDVSKVEAGKLQLEKAPFNLKEVMEELCSFHRHAAELNGLTLSLKTDASCDAYFMLDHIRLRQIIGNLISNSIKFTEQGEITVSVRANKRSGRDYEFLFEVSDTGRGMDQTSLEQIFSPFVQPIRPVDGRPSGTGLGLTIARSLVELFGGSITADSMPDKGSHFSVLLPLVRCEVGISDTLPANADGKIAKEELTQGTRVLLAEDHHVNQRVVQLILEPLGIDVEIVENGRLAVDAFQNNAFDLILMDVRMPELDGLSAVREIRKIEAEHKLARTPVLMLSANAMTSHTEESLAAGADAHVAKPITADKLVNAIKAALYNVKEPDLREAAGLH